MDSLSQAVLGAAVGVAVAGRRIGARKAAVTGAVLGTVPDLDVFIPYGDPVSDFVLHRGPTHSLIVQAVVTPLFAEPLMRIMSGLRERRWTAYLMVYLIFATHALLDAVTVYGTRLLWPVVDHPFGIGSMFIIDPLYTLPLLIVTVWALFQSGLDDRLRRVTNGALIFTTAYIAWSIAAQGIAEAKVRTALDEAGLPFEKILASPTPFNTVFWRAIVIESETYLNAYTSVVGGDVVAHRHDRGTDLVACLDEIPHAATVAAFSKGFYRLAEDEQGLRIGDLRMGLTPSFVFDFLVAVRDDLGFTPVTPVQLEGDRSGEGDWEWLGDGLVGTVRTRPVEAAGALDLTIPQLVETGVPAAPPPAS